MLTPKQPGKGLSEIRGEPALRLPRRVLTAQGGSRGRPCGSGGGVWTEPRAQEDSYPQPTTSFPPDCPQFCAFRTGYSVLGKYTSALVYQKPANFTFTIAHIVLGTVVSTHHVTP